MIAYRLHFERANLEAVEIVRSGKLGEPRALQLDVHDAGRGRATSGSSRERGGGTLYDIGIYCINAARYLFRAEPIEVFA